MTVNLAESLEYRRVMSFVATIEHAARTGYELSCADQLALIDEMRTDLAHIAVGRRELVNVDPLGPVEPWPDRGPV